MRLIRAALVLLMIALFAGPARAQQDDAELALNPSIANKLRWVQFGIFGGRLVGSSAHYGTNVSSTTSNPLTGGREKLTVDITSGLPGIRYEMTNAREELAIELAEGDQLSIRRTRKSNSPVVSLAFQQVTGQNLSLTLGEGSTQRILRGESIWHLLIAHPTDCRKHLLPVLELLRPNWRLATTATALEEALLRRAGSHTRIDRQAWAALVAQLNSDRFASREAADHKLRAAGYSVLAYLQNLDRKSLDAEQRDRIREIIDSLSDQQEDSVERTVISLASDPQIWLSLLDREPDAKRRQAAGQLAALLDGAIEFDAAADEATRQLQIAAIRARLAGAVK